MRRTGTPDAYATHARLLAACIKRSKGPILECGAGYGSTPLIHELCRGTGRKIVTLDDDVNWVGQFAHLADEHHTIAAIHDWNLFDYAATRWSVVLVDQRPASARLVTISALLHNCDWLVVHDTGTPTYFYEPLFSLFKYRFDDKTDESWATVLSQHEEFEPPLGSTVVRGPAKMLRDDVNGEILLVNLEDQRGYCLNGIGSCIWQLLQQPITIAALVEQLLSEFDVDPDTCEAEVREFLSQLHLAELISIDSR